MKFPPFFFLCLLMFFPTVKADPPIFPNSIVSNDIDFILSKDPSAFLCVMYKETRRAEMPDKRGGALFENGVYIYTAHYKDGSSVELWADPSFESQSSAKHFISSTAQAIGKLPTFMRIRLDHVVIHKGDEVAFSESDGNFFVLYSENINKRFKKNDLEETVFHESVHATLDSRLLNNHSWRRAQLLDLAYITKYAANHPFKEDLAESALFAWTLLMYPGRLPQKVETSVQKTMPNRLTFFGDLFQKQPVFYNTGKVHTC